MTLFSSVWKELSNMIRSLHYYTLGTNIRDVLKKHLKAACKVGSLQPSRWKQNKASVSFLFCCNLLNVS